MVPCILGDTSLHAAKYRPRDAEYAVLGGDLLIGHPASIANLRIRKDAPQLFVAFGAP
jgi:hypothetical protein